MVRLSRGYCLAFVLLRSHHWYCCCCSGPQSRHHRRRFALGLIVVFLGLVLPAHDNLEAITATPLQLQTFWYLNLSNDAALMTAAIIRYLYFFPWHSRTMSSMGGGGRGSIQAVRLIVNLTVEC